MIARNAFSVSRDELMKHIPVLVGVACWASQAMAAANAPTLTPAQQEVVKVSEILTAGFNRRDFKTVSQHVAPEMIATGGDGGTYERPASLEAPGIYSTSPDSDQYRDRRDVHVRVNGDVAVMNFMVTEVEKIGSSTIATDVRINETYQKRGGAWLLLSTSVTEHPVNRRKAITMDPRKLLELAGQYQWSPDSIDTLTVEDGKLMQQLTGGHKDEILFSDENTQFQSGDLGWTTFTRDAQGKVTGYTYHRYDGQETWVRKIR